MKYFGTGQIQKNKKPILVNFKKTKGIILNMIVREAQIQIISILDNSIIVGNGSYFP